jgi:hypothetical protein
MSSLSIIKPSCFSRVPIEGTLDKEKYIDLLDNYLVSETKHLKQEQGQGFLFMQNNARHYTAKKTLAFLRKEKIKILLRFYGLSSREGSILIVMSFRQHKP